MGLKVIALGTGVCSNCYMGCGHADRKPPGFLVDVDGTLILLDCGAGVRYQLQLAGYDYGHIQHVAVTHAHPDHAALAQYLQAKSCRRIFNDDHHEFGVCSIYMPSELVEGFDAVWRWHVPENDGKYWAEFTPQFVPVGEGSCIGIAPDVTLKAFPVYHAFGKHPSVAYRVETPYGVIAYSGDSAKCDGLIEAAKDSDIFICEQAFRIGYEDKSGYGHLTPFEVGEVAKEANASHVRMVHYIGMDKEEDVIAEVRRGGFKGDVKRAKDFDMWTLD
jgi:ribonuclease BN (tRNA processing enzyme)